MVFLPEKSRKVESSGSYFFCLLSTPPPPQLFYKIHQIKTLCAYKLTDTMFDMLFLLSKAHCCINHIKEGKILTLL